MTLAEKLVEAEAAYHDLLTGKSIVELRDSNGETVRYTAANRSSLQSYISSLKAQIAASNTGSPLYEGPLRVFL